MSRYSHIAYSYLDDATCTVLNSGNVLLRGLVNSDLYVQSPYILLYNCLCHGP